MTKREWKQRRWVRRRMTRLRNKMIACQHRLVAIHGGAPTDEFLDALAELNAKLARGIFLPPGRMMSPHTTSTPWAFSAK